MTKKVVVDYLFDRFKEQGLLFVLMAIAIVFFYFEFNNLSLQLQQCNEDIIELFKTDHEEMRKVISNNTAAINALKNN